MKTKRSTVINTLVGVALAFAAFMPVRALAFPAAGQADNLDIASDVLLEVLEELLDSELLADDEMNGCSCQPKPTKKDKKVIICVGKTGPIECTAVGKICHCHSTNGPGQGNTEATCQVTHLRPNCSCTGDRAGGGNRCQKEVHGDEVRLTCTTVNRTKTLISKGPDKPCEELKRKTDSQEPDEI